MAVIMDGKVAAQQADQEFAMRIQKLKQQNIIPGLAVILIGDDAASQVYVRNKARRARKIGINYQLHRLDRGITQEAVLQLITQLNQDTQVDGIMVQMPVPKQIDANAVMNAILPQKDVDGFSFANIGRLWGNAAGNFPATPRGVLRLLRDYHITIEGQQAVVVGRSDIVGKPMAGLLLKNNSTVTIAHSKTQNLAQVTQQADLLIVAIGQAEFITADFVKPGAAVVDVGMNHNAAGKLVGDVDFKSVKQIAGYLTPVPGGVGPMTITGLLEQVIVLAEQRATL
ncbi:bifunctional methylenetetrahydrofolate dehydrogenase/methenyltetrahydrofolate cyclohydrolase [Bombilactobacillus folatiphilus]|uniref:Bifunctional protein FolD n=1 Tax=Bombilactobacillus folatiphilus TaxID=2923362 RepID=A0ABY4P7J4_9LACO|nr:tetrahydrofolate dehydrogenase/cyclohydrolase catalytic domain-containing protein [Bombilactobacillus folatiphilus]UQS81627.1 bifunctional methylenetetrahydrofolate dehydrogenase/methenyltetrahydrofolate cyclohydrolase [Bombilactobacillus folatiphilus]